MTNTKQLRWRILLIAGIFMIQADRQSFAEDPPGEPADNKPATEETSDQLPWHETLAAGVKAAQVSGKPILVRVGASWCGWCEKLKEEIVKPEVQKELSRWTLVYLDADERQADARQLSVGPIPALRVLAASGKVVGTRDGYLEHDELLTWLKQQFSEASKAPITALLETGPPSERDVKQLLKAFGSQSSLERETAIRRLLPYPAQSAKAVVGAFAEDRLTVRLAAIDLFDAWKAPITGLDPWAPETVTAERLTALSAWADKQAEAATDQGKPRELTPEEKVMVAAEITRITNLGESDADAAIERLVRFRETLLPLVYEALKTAPTDQARERLGQLRYRLMATDALVLRWPNGIKRLASTDLPTRHKAATELTEIAASADEPLLLELFGDPDALVRELSLRALRNLAGDEPSAALVRLLGDPEPNVRAAVLKQLTENPAQSLVPQVAKYVLKEKDADLVVHGIRFLKEVKTAAATSVLMKLLSHESWQVRAEATEALAALVEHNSQDAADIYVALIERLEDPDAFVVSRAIKGLKIAELEAKLKPLVDVASQHPELAAEVVDAITSTSSLHAKALPYLREFAKHKNPLVRARAIHGLVATDSEFDQELLAGLEDEAPEARIAAVEAILEMFDAALTEARGGTSRAISVMRSPGLFDVIGQAFFGKKTSRKPSGEKTDQQAEENDGDFWLREYHAGKNRPEWMAKTIAPLEKMLFSNDKHERLLAAVALVALGKHKEALPVLEATADSEPKFRAEAAAALPWLLWPERKAFFERLMSANPDGDQLYRITTAMGKSIDLRSTGPLWSMLERKDAGNELASRVYHGLDNLYESKQIMTPEGERRMPPEVLDAWKKFATEGQPWQRVLALALMVNHQAQADAEEIARPMLEDERLTEPFRVDALQIVLTSLAQAEAEKLAVQQIGSSQIEFRKLSLRYLTLGPESLRSLHEQIWLNGNSSYTSYGAPIEIEPPPGITEETIRPLLTDADAEVAASAGYLLATLGKADGLDRLVKQWRAKGKQDGWSRALYRAIAVLDDDRYAPILAEINKQLDQWDRREFYWTIRSMEGPEVRKLRKQIRDEVGMENLK